MKKIYEMTKEEVFESVRSSEKGLKTEQAEERLQAYGENVLKEKNKKNPIKIFFSQFSNMMVLLLILVGIVSLVYSIVNGESVIESVVIFSCLLINIIMGFVQEMNSENAIDALKTMTQSKVQVKRVPLRSRPITP